MKKSSLHAIRSATKILQMRREFRPSLQPSWSPFIFPFLFTVEELYGARYQSCSFSLINAGSGFHCLHIFFFSRKWTQPPKMSEQYSWWCAGLWLPTSWSPLKSLSSFYSPGGIMLCVLHPLGSTEHQTSFFKNNNIYALFLFFSTLVYSYSS